MAVFPHDVYVLACLRVGQGVLQQEHPAVETVEEGFGQFAVYFVQNVVYFVNAQYHVMYLLSA